MPEAAARYDNPAERLRNILIRSKDLGADVPLRIGWARILDIEDEDDRSLVLHKLGKVLALPGEVRAAVSVLEAYDPDLHTAQLHPIEVALSNLNLDGQKWQTFRDRITDAMLLGLRAASHELSRHSAVGTVSDDQIEAVRSQLQELIDEVGQVEDEVLRSFLLKHLRWLRTAVEDFKIDGAEALERAVAAAFGSLQIHRDVVERPESKPWMNRLGVALLLVGQLASASNATLALAERAESFLQEDPAIEVVLEDIPDPGADAPPENHEDDTRED